MFSDSLGFIEHVSNDLGLLEEEYNSPTDFKNKVSLGKA